MTKDQIIRLLEEHGFPEGRMIARSKTKYGHNHPAHFVIFNALVYSRHGRLLKQVDLDLTLDAATLTKVARLAGENLYVLFERTLTAARVSLSEVRRRAVFWTRITQADEDRFQLVGATKSRRPRGCLNCVIEKWLARPAYSLDILRNPEWNSLNLAGAGVLLGGSPPTHLRRLKRDDAVEFRPSRTLGRPVRPVLYHHVGGVDLIWFSHGKAVSAVLFDNSVGLMENVRFTCHRDHIAIHVHLAAQVIGLIWPCSIFSPEIITAARTQLKHEAKVRRAKAGSSREPIK